MALAKGGDVIRPIVQKTAEWAGGLMRCGEYERLASGEFILLFLDCGRTDDRLLTMNGGPLEQVVIEDAPITTNWYLGVPKKSAHPNLATLFAGFVASPTGQAIIDKHGGTTSHRVPGTPAHKQANEMAARGIKLLFWTPDDLLTRSKKLAEYRREFQRTLRIPDDGKAYPLPPGLGRFPLRHLDDYARRLPADWLRRGGVITPMHQAEAMWINLRTGSWDMPYPFRSRLRPRRSMPSPVMAGPIT